MMSQAASELGVKIPDKLFFKIGDVADLIDVKPYVLRYWESEFTMIHPQKSVTGQRIYRRGDVETLLLIKHLLYAEKYSIEGARKRLKELKKGGELQVAKAELAGDVPKRSELISEAKQASNDLLESINSPIRNLFRY